MQRPTLVLAHNKTLAAQLYGEFREFFPHNAVEYFVSYYDYYQPEAYVPSSDTYIEKDASINEHIEQMRLSATKALLERPDAIIVATVSAIYGLGDPKAYLSMVLHLSRGDRIDQRKLLRRLADMQYTRNDMDLTQGTYRVRGDVIDIFPAESEREAIRVELFDDTIDALALFDPLTGAISRKVPRFTVYPGTHYVTPRERIIESVDRIREDLRTRLRELRDGGKLLEAQRLEQRTMFDMEMMQEVGYCAGIENYSRYLSGRAPGEPPPTLFDYLPANSLLVIDESHQTIPQLGAMYKGDRSRKETLVEYGFRLPSALDNRPLRFEEWEALAPQMIFVSATPGNYERTHAAQVVEQLVRPTGLVDPEVEIRPVRSQVDDVLSEINKCVAKQRARADHHADQAHGGRSHRVSQRARRARALPALGHRDRGAHGDHPRSAPRQVRRARRHQPAARRPGHAGGVAGRDPRCGQGRLPALRQLAHPDDRPRGAQHQRPRDSVRRLDHRLHAARARGDRIAGARSSWHSTSSTASRRAASRRRVTDIMEGAARRQGRGFERPPARQGGARAAQSPSPLDLRPQTIVRQIKKLEGEMFKRARNLEFEEAARMRDEIERLKQIELGLAGHPGRLIGLQAALQARFLR